MKMLPLVAAFGSGLALRPAWLTVKYVEGLYVKATLRPAYSTAGIYAPQSAITER